MRRAAAKRDRNPRPGNARSFVRPLLAFWCALLLLGVPSFAQNAPPAAAAEDGAPLFYADFGWGGQFPGDRWGPVTVWVTGGDEAFSGVMVAEHPQDSTQSARVAVPFATTPGKTTPVRFVLALPNICNRITFTLQSENGRSLRSLTYATAPSGTEALLQPLVSSFSGLLVSVGRTSLHEASRGWSGAADPVDLDRSRFAAPPPAAGESLSEIELRLAWSAIQAARIDPAALPLTPVAFDGVLALVVEAGAASDADPRALQAVHDWVRAGGRLVIVASEPGETWRAWLPPGPEGDLVTLGPLQQGAIPPRIKSLIDSAAAAAARRRQALEEGDPLAQPDPTDDPVADEPLPSAASHIHRRLITLTPAASAEGWALRWPDTASPSAGAIAEGPVGLGWVTILGLDPQRTSEILSTRASAAVWKDALAQATADWVHSAAHLRDRWGRTGWAASGGRSQALSAALTSLADVPTTSDSLFVAIAAAMALLALLVGPGDYFILRRFRVSQRSWLTALLWIAAGSAAAYAAPTLLRSGPTLVNRLTTVDRLVRPGDPPSAPAFQTGVTGIFAAESGRFRFTTIDPASWWRGVSAADIISSQTPIGSAVLSTAQAPGDSERGNPLDRVGMSLWTFRTFMDHAGPPTSLTARLRPDPAGDGMRLTVAGLPEGASIDRAVVRLGEAWIPLDRAAPEDIAGGLWETSFPPPEPPYAAPPEWLPGSTPQTYDPWGRASIMTVPEVSPGDALALAGPDRRTLAIDRRVATGRWACVQLRLKGLPPDLALDRPAEFQRSAVVRLVVPIEGDGPAPLPPPEDQP